MKCYRVWIHLAHDEWNNDVMQRVAEEYAAANADKRPLIVKVYEHGGWWLSYLFGAKDIPDGTICGTANDAATLRPDVMRFGESIEIEELGDIHRDHKEGEGSCYATDEHRDADYYKRFGL